MSVSSQPEDNCLPLAELERLVTNRGSLRSESMERRHLVSCKACRRRLREVRLNLQVLDQLQASGGALVKRAAELKDAYPRYDEAAWLLGEEIGQYRLLRILGRGAFGIVYLASCQTAKSPKLAAVKVIKPGMDTEEVLGRFDTERKVLESLHHENIAQVLGAGITSNSRPFFVMEYVNGVRVTEHCDYYRLSLKQRLALFVRVCNGVQHAHHRGVVHRDLKPSNVLVAIRQDQAVPKVIDFGIAKALDWHTSLHATYTGFGRPIGTPAYMSPEQAAGRSNAVDLRADVYSLGVMLYELIAGTLPFDLLRSPALSFERLQHMILAMEPPIPSARLASLGEDALEVAQRRGTDPQALRQQVRGDLDCIVMRAVEKNPARRYPSAAGLANELTSYLRKTPVQAARPRFSRTHRELTEVRPRLLVALITTLLVGAVFWSVWPRLSLPGKSDEPHEGQRRQVKPTHKNPGWPMAPASRVADDTPSSLDQLLGTRPGEAETSLRRLVDGQPGAPPTDYPKSLDEVVEAALAEQDREKQDKLLRSKAVPQLSYLDPVQAARVVAKLLEHQYIPAYEDLRKQLPSCSVSSWRASLFRTVKWQAVYGQDSRLAEMLLCGLVRGGLEISDSLVPTLAEAALANGSSEVRNIMLQAVEQYAATAFGTLDSRGPQRPLTGRRLSQDKWQALVGLLAKHPDSNSTERLGGLFDKCLYAYGAGVTRRPRAPQGPSGGPTSRQRGCCDVLFDALRSLNWPALKNTLQKARTDHPEARSLVEGYLTRIP